MRYQCPCCGYYTYTLPPEKDYGFICPVCFWESDKHVKSENDISELNHDTTLSEARSFFQSVGACHPRMANYVRAPKEDELPSSNTGI